MRHDLDIELDAGLDGADLYDDDEPDGDLLASSHVRAHSRQHRPRRPGRPVGSTVGPAAENSPPLADDGLAEVSYWRIGRSYCPACQRIRTCVRDARITDIFCDCGAVCRDASGDEVP